MGILTHIALFFVLVIAAGRITRNITFDDFPPTKAIRDWWDVKTGDSGWNTLFHCSYCMAVWVSLPLTVVAAGLVFGWAIFATFSGLFWVFITWMAVGYLAGILVATDWG